MDEINDTPSSTNVVKEVVATPNVEPTTAQKAKAVATFNAILNNAPSLPPEDSIRLPDPKKALLAEEPERYREPAYDDINNLLVTNNSDFPTTSSTEPVYSEEDMSRDAIQDRLKMRNAPKETEEPVLPTKSKWEAFTDSLKRKIHILVQQRLVLPIQTLKDKKTMLFLML